MSSSPGPPVRGRGPVAGPAGRLFVDDRNAAEDLVQEGFIRLARSAHRIEDPSKAAAYLRSIVLNLARDHNRRGLVSSRHHLPLDDHRASPEDEIVLRDDQQEVMAPDGTATAGFVVRSERVGAERASCGGGDRCAVTVTTEGGTLLTFAEPVAFAAFRVALVCRAYLDNAAK